MAITECFPLTDYPADLKPDGLAHVELESAPTSVPLGATEVILRCDRSAMPEDKTVLYLKGRALVSYNDGKTWELLFAFTTTGGLIFDDKGLPITHTHVKVGIPQPENPSRQIKAHLIPLKPLRTDLSLEIL